jgi:hypothetical protein
MQLLCPFMAYSEGLTLGQYIGMKMELPNLDFDGQSKFGVLTLI